MHNGILQFKLSIPTSSFSIKHEVFLTIIIWILLEVLSAVFNPFLFNTNCTDPACHPPEINALLLPWYKLENFDWASLLVCQPMTVSACKIHYCIKNCIKEYSWILTFVHKVKDVSTPSSIRNKNFFVVSPSLKTDHAARCKRNGCPPEINIPGHSFLGMDSHRASIPRNECSTTFRFSSVLCPMDIYNQLWMSMDIKHWC